MKILRAFIQYCNKGVGPLNYGYRAHEKFPLQLKTGKYFDMGVAGKIVVCDHINLTELFL